MSVITRAGSASSAPKASSAAPTVTARGPSAAPTTGTSRRGSSVPAQLQLVIEGGADRRKDPGEEPTEHDDVGIEHVDQTGDSDRQPARLDRERGHDGGLGSIGPFQQILHRRSAAVGIESRTREQCRLAHLGLPAPHRSAAAQFAVGIDRHVTDLPGESVGPTDRSSGIDEPSTDADLTRDVDHLIEADGGAEAGFGERSEVGIVADRDRQTVGKEVGERLAHGDVDPADVRRGDHQPVATANESRHRDTATDELTLPPFGVDIPAVEQRREVGDRGIDVEAIAGAGEAHAAHQRTVEGDDRRADLVDEDLDRKGTDRSIVDPDEGRRAPGAPVGFRRLFDHETEEFQLADESGDGTAGEPGCPHELRARAWTATQSIEHQRQIRTPEMGRPSG